ncbi:MAG: InlB B-repeat-containing protein [Clostridia bacterium]|nr:InlB B-repeat-containing protein [Clostridia bacterium]
MAKKALIWSFVAILAVGLGVSMFFLISKTKVSAVECNINRVCYVLDGNSEKVESETITEENFKKLVYSKNFDEEVLADLEKVGYSFSGWFGSDEFKQDNKLTTETIFDDNSVAVNKEEKTATIYAYFAPNSFSSLMYASNGDNIIRNSNEVFFGQTIGELVKNENLKAASLDNKVFYGWYADSNFTQKLSDDTKLTFENIRFDPIMQTFMIYARYIDKSCTLVCGNTDEVVTQDYGTALALPTPAKDGYELEGWYFDKELENKIELSEENPVLLNFDTVQFDGTNFYVYAKWTPKKITLTFDAKANGGSCDEEEAEFTFGEVYGTLPTATKDGDRFAGWFTNTNDVTTKITENSVVSFTENTEVKAKFVKEDMIAFTVEKSDNVTYEIFYRNPKNTNTNNEQTNNTDDNSSDENADDNTDDNANSNTQNEPTWTEIHTDNTATASALTYYIKSGFNWKVVATVADEHYELTNAEQTGTAEEDAKITVTATGKTYELVLNNNNDEVGNSTIQHVYGTSLARVLQNITKSGYVFGGWYGDANFTKKLTDQDVLNEQTATFITTTEQTESGETTKTTANIYAKWLTKQVKVNSMAIAAQTRLTNIVVYYELRNINDETKVYQLINGADTKTFEDVKNGTYSLWASDRQYKNITDTSTVEYVNTNLTITITDETLFTEVYVYYCPLYVSIPDEEANQGIAAQNTKEPSEQSEQGYKFYQTGWYLKGQTFNMEVPVNTGYHFKNWTWEDGVNDYGVIGTENPITYQIDKRMKILPHTEKNVYTIEFNANGGNEIESITREYLSALGEKDENDALAELPVPTRGGCVFLGWFADSEFTKQVTNETIINTTTFTEEQLKNNNSTLTLYAKWVENEVEISVLWGSYGAASYAEVELESISTTEEETPRIKTTTKEGDVVKFNAVPAGDYYVYAISKYNMDPTDKLFDNTGVEAKLVKITRPTTNPETGKIEYTPITISVPEPSFNAETETITNNLNKNNTPTINYVRLNLLGKYKDDEGSLEPGIKSVNQNGIRYLKYQTVEFEAELEFGYTGLKWLIEKVRNDATKEVTEWEEYLTITAINDGKVLKGTVVMNIGKIFKATASPIKTLYDIIYNNGDGENLTQNSKQKQYGTAFVSDDLKAPSTLYGKFVGWSTKEGSTAEEDLIKVDDIFNISTIPTDTTAETVTFNLYAVYISQCEIKNAETEATLTTLNWGDTNTTLLVPQNLVNKTGYNFVGFKLNENDAKLFATNNGLTENKEYSCALTVNVTNADNQDISITNGNGEWVYFETESIELYPVYEPKTIILSTGENGYTFKLTYDSDVILQQGNKDQQTGEYEYNPFTPQEGNNIAFAIADNTSSENGQTLIDENGKLKFVEGYTKEVTTIDEQEQEQTIIVWAYEGETFTLVQVDDSTNQTTQNTTGDEVTS